MVTRGGWSGDNGLGSLGERWKGMEVVGSQGGRRIGERWRSTKGMGDRGKEENVRVQEHRCMTDEA